MKGKNDTYSFLSFFSLVNRPVGNWLIRFLLAFNSIKSTSGSNARRSNFIIWLLFKNLSNKQNQFISIWKMNCQCKYKYKQQISNKIVQEKVANNYDAIFALWLYYKKHNVCTVELRLLIRHGTAVLTNIQINKSYQLKNDKFQDHSVINQVLNFKKQVLENRKIKQKMPNESLKIASFKGLLFFCIKK